MKKIAIILIALAALNSFAVHNCEPSDISFKVKLIGRYLYRRLKNTRNSDRIACAFFCINIFKVYSSSSL